MLFFYILGFFICFDLPKCEDEEMEMVCRGRTQKKIERMLIDIGWHKLKYVSKCGNQVFYFITALI